MSFKDLQNQRVTVPTLEYHNRNWTWTDMLMEVKRDYKIAIVGQTIKSAIGMKGSSDEVAGLASPKLTRLVRSCSMGTHILLIASLLLLHIHFIYWFFFSFFL